jgi:hypothetical protein
VTNNNYNSHTTYTKKQKQKSPFHFNPSHMTQGHSHQIILGQRLVDSAPAQQRAAKCVQRPRSTLIMGCGGWHLVNCRLSQRPPILSISFLCIALAQIGRIVALRKVVVQRPMILVRWNGWRGRAPLKDS